MMKIVHRRVTKVELECKDDSMTRLLQSVYKNLNKVEKKIAQAAKAHSQTDKKVRKGG